MDIPARLLTREPFVGDIRDALAHLYDSVYLRQSTLAVLFNVSDRFDAALSLRTLLLDAIVALKPRDVTPANQRAWRIHDALSCCYVQQLSQQVVADQLAISTRQLRRELHAAIEALADVLWAKYRLQPEAAEVGRTPSIDRELSWLRSNIRESSNLDEAVARAFELAQHLATEFTVELISDLPADMPPVAVHPVALNQMLLNLITLAIPRASCGRLVISSVLRQTNIVIRLLAERACELSLSADDLTGIDLTRQLADFSGGDLMLSQVDNERFDVALMLPALEQRTVLVVDDNADTLQLLERYAAGTRYRVVTTRDPEAVTSLAESLLPHVIVLDVMMPQVDGWMLLGRLRHHPATQDTPIVVCSILAQEKLALSLGANGFLKKPVSRQDFLAVLDLVCDQLETL